MLKIFWKISFYTEMNIIENIQKNLRGLPLIFLNLDTLYIITGGAWQPSEVSFEIRLYPEHISACNEDCNTQKEMSGTL